MYFVVGLLLIIVGWIIQLGKTLEKEREISPYFLIFYALGVLFLVLGNLLIGDISTTLLNLISAILPIAVLILIKKG